MADKKRMGGMGLASFGKSTPAAKTEAVVVEPAETTLPTVTKSKNITVQKAKSKKTVKSQPKAEEKTATLNIQITRSQQRWLQDTAQDIRDNNDEPVAGPDRVYPVHLIQAAIELLRSQDVSWAEIHDVKGLKDALNL
jgi:hypothetical protein